jgi:hypothetical protein
MLPDRRAKQCFAWLIERRYNNSPLKTEGIHQEELFSILRLMGLDHTLLTYFHAGWI